MNPLPDIYFLPEWCKLHEEKDNGTADAFLFENRIGKVYYQFIKRPIDLTIDAETYFDIITPYGFNGPIILESHEDRKEQLIKDWFCAFVEYCKKSNIIAEYIRFNPWLKNYSDFENYYELVHNKYTLAVNLEVDFFMKEFSSMRRRNVRKSMRSNVLIEFDFEGKALDEFFRLYNKTVIKNNISEYYQISLKFFGKMFVTLRDNVFLINAKFDGKYISSAMFLHYGDYIHYHFSGNDNLFFPLCANSYILYEACRWGKNHGKKKLHLGGFANDENLLNFKKTFTKNEIYDFYVGKA